MCHGLRMTIALGHVARFSLTCPEAAASAVWSLAFFDRDENIA
jgi:hypothetical protein